MLRGRRYLVVCLIGLAFFEGRGETEPAPAKELLVLLLTTPREPTPVRAETLLLALSLQLDPYRIRARHEVVAWSETLASQIREARERGQRAGALAVIWYAEESAVHSVVVHVLDLRDQPPPVHSLALGRPSMGIERSIALAVRTLLRARPLELASQPASRAAAMAPTLPVAPPPARGAPPRTLLLVGASYALDGYPLGQDLRHGPELTLSLQLWRLRGRMAIGYRLPRSSRSGASEWTRSVWCFSWLASARLFRGARWEVTAGPRLGLGAVQVQARALDSTRTEEASLYELSLGAEAGARVRLGRRLTLELSGMLAGLPLSQSFTVQGREALGSGRLALTLGAGVDLGFF